VSCIFTDPRLTGLEMGSKAWFQAQYDMVRSKPLVRRCYDLWYRKLLADADSVPGDPGHGAIVELGSGSSYIKELRPEVVTSDVVPGVADMVIDARSFPFPNASVRAILLTHVFHHIPDVEAFFTEAGRVLVPGGVISIIDETHTPFARLFFSKIHPEPYRADAREWSFPQGHTMLDSNQALSWIVFFRDREKFARDFPNLRLEACEYLPWLTYLLSGGVNLRSLVPPSVAPVAASLDKLVKPLDGLFAIHWHLRVRKSTATGALQ
jgi:SAM-dependent methyltransferase